MARKRPGGPASERGLAVAQSGLVTGIEAPSSDRAALIAQAAMAEAELRVAEAAFVDARRRARDLIALRNSAVHAAPGTSASQQLLFQEVPTPRPAHRRSSLAGKPVGDYGGQDLRPDPLLAKTAAELVEAMRLYRIWAGEPPFRTMASLGGAKVAASTLCAALRSPELPSQKVVVAFIAGCGGDEEERQRYATAWRKIRFANDAGSAPAQSNLHVVPAAARAG